MSTRTALDRVLAFDGGARWSRTGWLVVALSLHAGLAGLLARRADAAPSEPLPAEIELAPPPPEPPPPPPEPTPELPPEKASERAPAPSSPTAPAAAPRPASAPPPAAKAGALVAAKDDSPAQTDDAVSFVTDPNGGSYGSGVVAKGGTAEVGVKGAAPAPVAASVAAIAQPPSAPTVAPAANLSQPPRLQASEPCKGYFPQGADDDHGSVTVQVVVRPDGTVASASIVEEAPKNQGFAGAARACLLATRFAPALDLSGAKTTAAATVKVRFSR